MSLIYSLFILLLLWPGEALGGLFSHHKKEALGSEIPIIKPFENRQDKSEPQVLSVTPVGPLEERSQTNSITVTFDRPMGALEVLPKEELTGPLLFDPPIEGRYRWFGTDTLVFIPKEPLPSGTRFTATIPAGTKAQDGSRLVRDYQWTFETFRPQLKNFRPYNGENFWDISQPLILIFNQPVSPERALAFLVLKGKPTAALFSEIRGFKPEEFRENFSFRLRKPLESDLKKFFISLREASNCFVLEPRRPLKREYTYAVIVKKGLVGAVGNLGLEKESVIQFKTYNRFRCLGITQVVHPKQGVEFLFSNPVSRKELLKAVKIAPPVPLEEDPSDFVQHQHQISLELEPHKVYEVHINSKLKDKFQKKLRKSWLSVVRTTSFVPEISAPSGRVNVESYLEPVLPIKTINIDSVETVALPVLVEEAIPILSKGETDWPWNELMKERGLNYSELKIQSDLDEEKTSFFDLKPFLGVSDSGFLLTAIQAKALRHDVGDYPLKIFEDLEELNAHRFSAFVQVTGLGITAKCSNENFVVWVTSLETGEPIEGARVELRDDLGKVVFHGITGSRGFLTTPGWNDLGQPGDFSRRVWIVAKKNDDAALISSDWTGYPRSGRFRPSGKKSFQIFIYTDAGLYRPGETVHIKGVIRERKSFEYSLPDLKNLGVVVLNARGDEVLKKTVTVSEFGSFSLDFTLDPKSPTGLYSVQIEEMGNLSLNGLGEFRVETFQAPNFETNVRLDKEGYVCGETAKGNIQGKYLFGAPMSGASLNWRARLLPSNFSPPHHEGYVFLPDLSLSTGNAWSMDGVIVSSSEARLDSNGEAHIEFSVSKNIVSVPATLELEGTVVDLDRESIANRARVLLHPASYYVGLKTGNFHQRDKPVSISVITVDEAGHVVSGRDVQLSLIRREYEPVRKIFRDGRTRWMREAKDVELEKVAVITRKEPLQIWFQPESAGVYFVRGESKDDEFRLAYSDLTFYVTGREYVPWGLEEEKRIEVVPDKPVYKPGEEARLIVKSPFEKGTILVSVEREGVLTQLSTMVYGGADVINVSIDEKFIPEVFVSVCLIRGRSEEAEYSNQDDDIGKPIFRMEYTTLKVDPGLKTLQVKAQSLKEEYRPKESAEIEIEIRDFSGKGQEAEFSMAVVDKGVTDLGGIQAPNLLKAFFGDGALEVGTVDTRAERAPLYLLKNMAVNGEGGWRVPKENVLGMGAAASDQDMVRSNFLNTTFWVASGKTDKMGKATLSFDLPDNLTTFKILVAAHTKSSLFGSGESAFQVKKPLIIKSSLPRFVRLGDKFKAGVVVHNLTGVAGEILLEAKSQGIQIKDGYFEQVISPDRKTKEVTFELVANRIGKTAVEFLAQAGFEKDIARFNLPVIQPLATETVVLSKGTVREEENEAVKIPDDIYPEIGGLTFETASTALLGLKEGIRYLQDFPHQCLEQKISRVLPFLANAEIIEAFGLDQLNGKDKKDVVEELLGELPQFQREDGGFGFWPGNNYSSDDLTAYVLEFLAHANSGGFSFNKKLMERALVYVRGSLNGERNSSEIVPFGRKADLTIKAHLLYALSLWNKAEPTQLDFLLNSLHQMSLFGRSMLMKSIVRTRMDPKKIQIVEDSLRSFMKVDPTMAHFEEENFPGDEWIFNSSVRTTAFILQAFLEAGRELPQAPKIVTWLMNQRQNGRWKNTQEDIRVFDALAEYFNKYETEVPNLWGTIRVGGREVLKQKFQGRQIRSNQVFIPYDELFTGQETSVRVFREGKGRLYYGIRMNYAPRAVGGREEGIFVKREITFPDGSPVPRPIPLGSKLLVKLTITTPAERSYVAVEDWLPGCFAIINPNFKTTTREDTLLAEGTSPFIHREFYDEKICFYADYLRPGTYFLNYLVLAKTRGEFGLPPATALEMYSPEVFGRTDSGEIEVK